VAIRPGGAKVYVTQSVWTGSVSVINTADNTVKSIPVGRFPMGVAVSPDGHWVFVANFLSSTLSVIDATTDSVVAAPSVNVGMLAMGVAVNPNSAKPYVYITNWGTNSVTIVRTTDLSTVVLNAQVGINPNGVAVAPDGSAVYVALEGDGKLVILDPQTAVVTGSVQVGSNPTGVAVAPDGRHVYVTNKKSNTLSVVDTNTLGVMNVQVGNEPTGVAVSSDGSLVYVSNSNSGSVSVLNALSTPPSPMSTISLAGSFPVGIALVPGAPVITVTIDVPHAINLRSQGTLPVTILSTDTFDATRVNPETVTLAHAPVKMKPNGTLMWSFEDVNGTGRLALVVQIDKEKLQLSPSDTEVVLEGQTYPDANNVVHHIRGAATVKVVP
jgi:YVTN family beta-propeller protein